MNPIEYLYIDSARLDSYFEQLSPPTKFDKVPTWNVELSLTGPKASGSQLRPGRPFTTHEKIAFLLKHLPLERLSFDSDFLYVRMRAQRIIITLKNTDGSPRAIAAWVGLNEHDKLRLFLVEEGRSTDHARLSVSGGSAIYNFLRELRRDFRSHLPSSDKLARAFSEDPVAVLESWGGQASAPRDVESLMRMRVDFEDGPLYIIIGYPVFVAEHPTGFEVPFTIGEWGTDEFPVTGRGFRVLRKMGLMGNDQTK